MPNGDFASLGARLAALLGWTGVVAVGVALLAAVVAFVHRLPAPASEPTEPRSRRFLRVAFGLLWIADGLLQAQPQMPAGFVPAVIQPNVAGAPGWLTAIVDPLTRAWTRHPVAADVALIWLEIGVGLLLLVAVRGRLARFAAWFTIAAAVAIWTLGEALGGLTVAGASWLTGSPGAALVYAMAAAVLLLPWTWWQDGRMQRVLRWATAAWLLVAVLLEALPVEGFWTGPRLAAPFRDGAEMSQPSWLNAPMPRLAELAGEHPVAVNLVVIILVAGVAAWLVWDGRTAAITAGLLVCAATWWLAQDFGVFGGTATDPNTGLPLGLFLAAALPAWQQQTAARRITLPATARTGLSALAIACAVVLPIALASTVGGPADSAAIAADSDGGVRAVPPRPAPAFHLVDQRGQPVSTASLRGKVIVLTFLDPVCTSDCPLIANQLAITDHTLGRQAGKVEFIAIDTNPVFTRVTDVAAFTQSHGMAGLHNWHFLCGPGQQVQDVLARYGVTVDVPTVGMIEHSEGLFFVTADGQEVAYLDDGAQSMLTETYADQVQREILSLLR